MSNRRRLVTFKAPVNPGMLADVAKSMDAKGKRLTREMRRAMRPNTLFASILQDHHKPHDRRDDCNPKTCVIK